MFTGGGSEAFIPKFTEAEEHDEESQRLQKEREEKLQRAEQRAFAAALKASVTK